MTTHYKNSVLTDSEMLDNAIYVKDYFTKKGWSLNAICALLANMQAESRVNPGAYQNYKVNNSQGFGLVQWTPATKYTSWCYENKLGDSIKTQCNRIQWELENGKQYYKTNSYPLTFTEFSQSKATPSYLSYVFLNNYERPANINQPIRKSYAEKWYSLFNVSRETLHGVITGDNVNVRLQPSTNSTILGSVSTNDIVDVMGESGDFVKINYVATAYISKKYVK